MASLPSKPDPSSSTASMNPTPVIHSPSKSIQALRQQAQAHLEEIESEKSQEEIDRQTRDAEVQKYMKPPRRSRAKAIPASTSSTSASTSSSSHRPKSSPSPPPQSQSPASSSSSPADQPKRSKLRPAADILARLQHDPTLDISEYVIGYLERFDGVAEIPVASWIRESTDEDFVPMHRIRWIKKKEKKRPVVRDVGGGDGEGGKEEGEQEEEETMVVVWDRDQRIDRVFGSRSGG